MLGCDLRQVRRTLDLGPDQSARTEQRVGRVERASGQDYSDGIHDKARCETGRNVALHAFAESRDNLLRLLAVREDNYGEGGKSAVNKMKLLRQRRVGHRAPAHAHNDDARRVGAYGRVRQELGCAGELLRPFAKMRAQQLDRARAPQWERINQCDAGFMTAIDA
jgi:hypothetical protein